MDPFLRAAAGSECDDTQHNKSAHGLTRNGVVGLRYPALDGEVVLDTRSITSAWVAATYEPSKNGVILIRSSALERAE